MVKRENGFGPVKSWIMTPAQQAEHDRRLQERSAPPIRRWQRTMTEDEYLEAVREGRSRADIVLKHFNNDLSELKKQLKDWGITEEGAVEMAKVKKEATITKEEYLQRRLKGEKRTQILRTTGIASPRAYELLKEWGIREIDAEERELELLSPKKLDSGVDNRVAEQIEQKAEARGLIAFNEQQETEPAGTDILERMEKRAAEREQELAELQAACALWKSEAEKKDQHIKGLEVAQHHTRDEVERVRQRAGARIQELESERSLLLQTIEQAAGEDAGFIALRIPILSVAIANVERARIYEAVEALSNNVEASEIDRERVMTELFDLLQRTVNFITADLAELHPGREVSSYVREFFAFYNERHVGLLTEIRKVG